MSSDKAVRRPDLIKLWRPPVDGIADAVKPTKLERHAGHDTRRVGVLGGRPGTRRLLGSDGTGRGDRTRGRRRWSSPRPSHFSGTSARAKRPSTSTTWTRWNSSTRRQSSDAQFDARLRSAGRPLCKRRPPPLWRLPKPARRQSPTEAGARSALCARRAHLRRR